MNGHLTKEARKAHYSSGLLLLCACVCCIQCVGTVWLASWGCLLWYIQQAWTNSLPFLQPPPGLALSLPCMIKENIEGELLLSNQALQQKHIHWRVNKHPDTDNSLAVLLHHLGPTLPTERGLLFLAWKPWCLGFKPLDLCSEIPGWFRKTILKGKVVFSFLFTFYQKEILINSRQL